MECVPGRPALQLSAASGSLQEERSWRGWVRVPPALLTVQPGWTGEEPSTASGLRELLRVEVQCVSTGGTCTRIQQAQTPKGKAGPLSPGWERSGRRGGALISAEARCPGKHSVVGGCGRGWERGLQSLALPGSLTSYNLGRQQGGFYSPTSSVLCCEGTCPCRVLLGKGGRLGVARAT